METMSYTDARGQFKKLLDRVAEDADYTVITRRTRWSCRSTASTA